MSKVNKDLVGGNVGEVQIPATDELKKFITESRDFSYAVIDGVFKTLLKKYPMLKGVSSDKVHTSRVERALTGDFTFTLVVGADGEEKVEVVLPLGDDVLTLLKINVAMEGINKTSEVIANLAPAFMPELLGKRWSIDVTSWIVTISPEVRGTGMSIAEMLQGTVGRG